MIVIAPGRGPLQVPIYVPKNTDLQIGVEDRDYHELSHSEIRGDKRISQHLSTSVPLEARALTVIAASHILL